MKIALFVAALVTAGAYASVDIRIDMSTFLGQTAGNWNNVSAIAGQTSNLIDFTTGAATGVSITGSSNWVDFFGDDSGSFGNVDWVVQPSTVDGAGIQSGTGTFTISGLNAGSLYSVEVVSVRSSFNYLNSFNIDGFSANRTFNGTAVVDPWNSTADGLTARNWLIWDRLTAANGTLVLTDSVQSTLGIVNAIRIVEVPGPGALTCCAVSAAAMATPRRRRNGR